MQMDYNPKRAEVIPAELQERKQWITWSRTKDGRKRPDSPTDDPKKFIEFARLKTIHIGFVFRADDPYCGIDLDDCRDMDTGAFTPWATGIMDRFKGVAYCEISPSGTGVKLTTRAKKPRKECTVRIKDADGKPIEKQKIECFEFNRFWAMTGNVLEGFEAIGDGQPAIDWLFDKFYPAKKAVAAVASTKKRKISGIERFSLNNRIQAYVDEVPGAIAGQNGHVETFKLAIKLVRGFNLDNEEALKWMQVYNQRCLPPWGEGELRHKIESARSDGDMEFGFLLEPKNNQSPQNNLNDNDDSISDEDIAARHYVDDPKRLAVMNLEKYEVYHGRSLKHWNQTWYRYKEGVYMEIPTDQLISRLTESIQEEFEKVWELEIKAYKAWKRSKDYDPDNDKGPPKVRKVKGSLVQDVYLATRSKCSFESGQKMHDWMRNKESHDGFCIAVENGILNISKAISETDHPVSEVIMPRNRNWFSTSKLNFNFDQNATCGQWTKFLDDVFDGDQESIKAIQKWFGYLLTPDNSLQKILFVIGQPRSGKGTIVQIMKELFGESNVATPKLSDLSNSFALQPLANKTVAIIPDARLSRRADETMITETLLSISGGDPQDVARKFKETLSSYQMKCRFTIFSNLVPNLKDLSSAFVTRCIFLHMPKSYVGREDYTLVDRLKKEMPGILNWAIVGRHLLNEEKRIEQPKAGKKFVSELKSLTSPILEFLESECEIGPSFDSETKEFFGKWESWCEENDIEFPGTVQNFIRKIKAIHPGVDTIQYRAFGIRSRKIIGLRIKDPQF